MSPRTDASTTVGVHPDEGSVRSGPERPAPGATFDLDPFGLVQKYDPNQPRDDRGRWSPTAGGGDADTVRSQLGYTPPVIEGGKLKVKRVFRAISHENYAKLRAGENLRSHFSGHGDYQDDMAGAIFVDYDPAGAPMRIARRHGGVVLAIDAEGLSVGSRGPSRQFLTGEVDRRRIVGAIEFPVPVAKRYNPNQPRDGRGRWTSGGPSSGVGASGDETPGKPTWQPTMTREDAEHWAADSVIQSTLTHTTGRENVADGETGIVDVGLQSGTGGVWGAGIYLGSEPLVVGRDGIHEVWHLDDPDAAHLPVIVHDDQARAYAYGADREYAPTLRVKADVRNPLVVEATGASDAWEDIGRAVVRAEGGDPDLLFTDEWRHVANELYNEGPAGPLQRRGYDAMVIQHEGPFEWRVGGDQVVLWNTEQAVVVVDESGQPEDYRFRKYNPNQPRDARGRWSSGSGIMPTSFSGSDSMNAAARAAGVAEARSALASLAEDPNPGGVLIDDFLAYNYWSGSYDAVDGMQQAVANIYSADSAYGGAASIHDYGRSQYVLNRIANAEPDDTPLYRGMHEVSRNDPIRNLEPGDEFDMNLSAFSPDKYLAQSYAGTGIRDFTIETRGPVRSFYDDQWGYTERVTAGRFRVVERRGGGIVVEQVDTFAPVEKAYNASQPRWPKGHPQGGQWRGDDAGNASASASGSATDTHPTGHVVAGSVAGGDFRSEADPERRFAELWQRTYPGYQMVRDRAQEYLDGREASEYGYYDLADKFATDVTEWQKSMNDTGGFVGDEFNDPQSERTQRAAFTAQNLLDDRRYDVVQQAIDVDSAGQWLADGLRSARPGKGPGDELWRGTEWTRDSDPAIGETFTLKPTATSPSRATALMYARDEVGTRTIFRFSHTTERFDLGRHQDWWSTHPESVVAGTFRVTGVTTSDLDPRNGDRIPTMTVDVEPVEQP